MTMGSAGSIARSFLTRSPPGMSASSTSTTARPRRNRLTSRMASIPHAVGYARRRAWRRKLATNRAEASSPSATRIHRWPTASRKFMMLVERAGSVPEDVVALKSRSCARAIAGTPRPNDRFDGRRLTVLLDEPELLDATVQRPDGEAQRARRLLLVVSEALEGSSDQIPLGLIEGRELVDDRGGGRRVGLGAEIGQARALDLVARAEREGPLEEILKLANVAGEVVAGQRRHRIGRDALHVAPEALVEPAQEIREEGRDVAL